MNFLDRINELAFLEEKWREKKAQMIVLWGKRRVGKTELVKQFMKNKPGIYYLSTSTNEKEQLHRFSQSLGKFFNEPLLETRGFGGWEEAFTFIAKKNRRFILAIDEFPYLIQSNPAIPSLFQKGWDESWSGGNMFLILLGSSMAMMENEVLGYRSPLYGRRTGQWRVDPMPFSSVGGFRSEKSFMDRLMHFSVAGGIPAYWLQFDIQKNFERNLKDHVLKKGAMLYDEVEFVLREELREPRYYFALLQAIAQGKRKLAEIVNATGIVHATANKYLGVLSDLRIVNREVPVTENNPLKSKKGLYCMIDEFFLFWFRFVFSKRAELEMGQTDDVFKTIETGISRFLAATYEKVSLETLWKYRNRTIPFDLVGRWWERNEEIDIVAADTNSDAILFGEVKWTE